MKYVRDTVVDLDNTLTPKAILLHIPNGVKKIIPC